MQLPFSKMHGIGNDFVVLDCREQPFALDTAQIRALAIVIPASVSTSC